MMLKTLLKVAAPALALVSLSGCTDIYSDADLAKFHADIHNRLGATEKQGSDLVALPVGTVVSTSVVPSSIHYSAEVLDKNGCGPDEHIHDSRPYCHGHQRGFITTSLPSSYELPWTETAGHSHHHTHPHGAH